MTLAIAIIAGVLLLLACCRLGRAADEQTARLLRKDGTNG